MGRTSVSDQQLHYLAKSGSIERAAHGIYRLQRFPAQRFEDVIVASLWAGEGAVASHETALAVYGLTEAMPRVIHVTVPRRFRGKRKGVVVHTAHLREDERTIREGVPVTTPARTIRDIAVRYGPSEAAEAGREAIARGIITRRRLTRELANDAEARSVLDLLDPIFANSAEVLPISTSRAVISRLREVDETTRSIRERSAQAEVTRRSGSTRGAREKSLSEQ